MIGGGAFGHLVEQIGDDFFCDCHEGIKTRMCKHSVGLLYKTEKLEISSDVRSKEIGKKRKRGRPKKFPACLSHSPEPVQAEEPIATSTYHQPSPDVTVNILEHISPVITSPIVTTLIQAKPKGRKRRQNVIVDECVSVTPPPAKRTRQQVRLSKMM